MGIVYTDITLKNQKDVLKAEIGYIGEGEIRQATVEAIVDTGAMSLVINEELREQLGLEVVREREVTLANNKKEIVKETGPIEVHWKNRSMYCSSLVASDSGKTLMGVVPLEMMDLMVDPVRLELVGAHGDEIVHYLL